MKKIKNIYVKWVDSASHDYHWTDIDKVNTEQYYCETLGFLVRETDTEIFVANSLYGSHQSCCMVMGIPKVAIIKKKYVKL